MTFRITGPGFYKNRRGEKVEIVRVHDSAFRFPCVAIDGTEYKVSGQFDVTGYDMKDIVGVWEEPVSCNKLNIPEQPMYDLTRVSERFRALEDGRSLSHPGGTVTLRNAGDAYYCAGPWSLVPETKRVVTKLWVFRDLVQHFLFADRSETPDIDGDPHCECLGAIEGSEQEEEVET